MLKKDTDDQLAQGSSPAMPASSVMAAMIALQCEPTELCSAVASSSAVAAAIDDEAVCVLLRGKTC